MPEYSGAAAGPLFKSDDAANGNVRLQAGSPAIDAGDNSLLPADVTDLDGDGDTTEPLPLDLALQPRVVDGHGDSTSTVDMGAYEFQPGAQGGNTDGGNGAGEPPSANHLLLPLLIPSADVTPGNRPQRPGSAPGAITHI